ncbi:hypothetical protein BDV35DRAFT_374501 [Aspergillus flavus]|uniref:Uncharacterized protein n=1 Tax=Aspergillus flavus TaxID=5059 RepID=A0A5N6GE93_ASPFL|nr:hypothetical protein BDV35DRAFT_374501 [Aspergillus flavus]
MCIAKCPIIAMVAMALPIGQSPVFCCTGITITGSTNSWYTPCRESVAKVISTLQCSLLSCP